MLHKLLFIPDDYQAEVAREMIAFFHTFYRFGSTGNNIFDLDNPSYQELLNNIINVSIVIGGMVFFILSIIVVRRCVLNIRSAFSRQHSTKSLSIEMVTVALLAFIAVSSLSGLLGAAQVDYSAGLVHSAMENTSTTFHMVQVIAKDSHHDSEFIRQTMDSFVTSFNETDIPHEAFELSVEALRLVHAAKDLENSTSILPQNVAKLGESLQGSYFWLRGTTSTVILCVAVSSFVSISAIGWSLMLPLRFSILVLLSVVPISHILIGVYLSSTLMTADFCAAPMNSTMSLFNNNSAVSYFMACQPNVSSPFNEPTAYVAENLNTSIHLQQQLEKYAMEHGAVGQRMKKDFLDPIGSSLQHIEKLLDQFDTVQNCSEISHARQKAEDAVCVYGILGLFSMWVHQILLCLLLFVGVVSTVLVYERVLERELRLDMRYQLLSSYEEDDMEHIYLTPE